MDINALKFLGFSQNELKIYQALVMFSELSVSAIAREADINRRNVYDSLSQLVAKGFVFEIRGRKENIFRAVNPEKLTELLSDQSLQITHVVDQLKSQYHTSPREEETFVYKGIEGYKNFMREMLLLNKPIYGIAGKAQFLEPRIASFMDYFVQEAEKVGLEFHILFDHEAKEHVSNMPEVFKKNSRILPQEYSTPSTMNIYGNRVVTLDGSDGAMVNDHSTHVVIINQAIADSFRVWFKALWSLSSEI